MKSLIVRIVLIGCAVAALIFQNVDGACRDIDETACFEMLRKNTNLCSDPVLSTSACPESCNLCRRTCYNCHATTSNVSMCTTSTCGQGEMCLLKTKSSPSGPDDFSMSCGPSSICSKKRDVDIDVDDVDREDRDIVIRCCDDDLCNMPVITTSVPTTPKTRGCIRDFIIMLEDSSSLAPYYPIIKLAVKGILSHMDLDTDGTRVAMGTFHGIQCTTRWELDRYRNKTELYRAIDDLKAHPDGSPNGFNSVAVEYLLHHFKQGNRPDVPDVILYNAQANMDIPDSDFLLANGHTEADAINLLHGQTESIVAIAFGNADTQELQQIASDSNHYIYIKNIIDMDSSGFQQQLNALLPLICT